MTVAAVPVRRPGPGTVEFVAMHSAGGELGAERCELIEEAALFVDVDGIGRYVLMWTPTDSATGAAGFVAPEGWLGEGAPPAAFSLAAGFAFSEGLFDRIDDVLSIARCPRTPDVIRIVLTPQAHARAKARRAGDLRQVRSGCGTCGAEDVAHLLRGVVAVSAATELSLTALQSLLIRMRERQTLWQASGGAHAALLFDPDGRPQAFAEDLGRHNALDKAIGQCLLGRVPMRGCGVVLSSRSSFEMVAKAARAGLAIVAGVSAASALAVRTAHAFGVTLAGFVRDDRATVYTHARRLVVATSPADGAGPGRNQARSAASESRTASGSGSARAA